MVISCSCLGQGIPPTRSINIAHLTAAVGKTVNVYSYNAVWAEHRASGTMLTMAEHRTHYLPVPSGCATCYATDAG